MTGIQSFFLRFHIYFHLNDTEVNINTKSESLRSQSIFPRLKPRKSSFFHSPSFFFLSSREWNPFFVFSDIYMNADEKVFFFFYIITISIQETCICFLYSFYIQILNSMGELFFERFNWCAVYCLCGLWASSLNWSNMKHETRAHKYRCWFYIDGRPLITTLIMVSELIKH